MTETNVPVNSFEDAFENEEIEKVKTSDEEILALFHMPGWKRVEEFINALIEEEKAETEMIEGELLEAYGARRLASDRVIKKLEIVKNHVEAIGKYADEQRKKRGDSETA